MCTGNVCLILAFTVGIIARGLCKCKYSSYNMPSTSMSKVKTRDKDSRIGSRK